MPSRTATSPATAVLSQAGADSLPGLQFCEPLSWRAGKSIAIGDLLRRLQALSKEMRDMEQEENDRESFNRVAKELVSPNLLAHKDKGIRAWTACCLVDILRLCAPDAPYTGQQLKDIFNMLNTSILSALADPSNAYNQQHLYVLNSLAQVKSIVLLTDIPDSEKLTANLFITFFDILAGSMKLSSGEQIGKNVEYHMTEILIIMVDESASLPPEVIDVIVAQFLRVDPGVIDGSSGKSKKGNQTTVDEKQSKLILKELPPSYNMAKTVCNSCSDKMARHISQYFNDIILDASATASEKRMGKRRRYSEDLDNSDLDISFGPTEEDLKELAKAHLLLRELWRACPGVLQNVIPQLEAELSAENVHLRLLATETFGDMISGIGAAGSPPAATLDPAAYPYISVSDPAESLSNQNILLKPSSPQPFSQAYPQAYNSFLSRRHDKSPAIRAAWTTGVCRILRTSAGGVGLSQQEEERLIRDLPRMLADADDKVRVAAVKAFGTFSLRDVVFKLGALGGFRVPGSVLFTMGERVRDRKHNVRAEAMIVLSRLWGVAVGELSQADERVEEALGAIPSKIFDTYFTNDLDIHLLIDRAMFENLLPLEFPPVKGAKATNLTNGNVQKAKHTQINGETNLDDLSPDRIRTERILLLAKSLDEKAKKVFYALMARQLTLAKAVSAYLRVCEDYNGGVMQNNDEEIKARLSRLIDSLAKLFPDTLKMSDHLWKFAKAHDRRAYQLLRFCMAPESDYRTVYKASREFNKRIEQANNATSDLQASLISLLYRVSSLVYNRSHVPAIMDFSRIEAGPLTATAQEMLRDISMRTPEVLKAQIQEICKHLQNEAPTSQKPNDSGAVDNLKACASFASRFAKEIPKDRQFVNAMMGYTLNGVPAMAAKHAVSVIMAASDKKELHAKEIVQKCTQGFAYGGKGFLARLAALSQVVLLAPEQTIQHGDRISEIAIEHILLQTQTSYTELPEEYTWSDTLDEECEAKCWALKILVNRVRSHIDSETLHEVAEPVYDFLSKLIRGKGEMLPHGKTPPAHKSRLRLAAAKLSLKLCLRKSTEALFTPSMFNDLSLVAHDPIEPVRSTYLQRLKKYLGSNKLAQRFHTLPFLFAYEPLESLQLDTRNWLRSRTALLHRLQGDTHVPKASILMESVFARLLSILAHHPDYSSDDEDLAMFTRYITFYLHSVANEENLSLIYHIAQRVKQMRDAIEPSESMDENLYHLSDLAQLTIRKFEDAQNWSMQTQPGKATLPRTLFTEIRDHSEAQRIAERNYISEELEDRVEHEVRKSMKAAKSNQHSRKRKSETDDVHDKESRDSKKFKTLPLRKASGNKEKKARTTNGNTPKVPKKAANTRRTESSEGTPVERRRSGRVRNDQSVYQERDDDEDDEEMMDGVAEWTYTHRNGRNGVEAEPNDAEGGREISQSSDVERDEWETPNSPPPSKSSPRVKKMASSLKAPRRGGKH